MPAAMRACFRAASRTFRQALRLAVLCFAGSYFIFFLGLGTFGGRAAFAFARRARSSAVRRALASAGVSLAAVPRRHGRCRKRLYLAQATRVPQRPHDSSPPGVAGSTTSCLPFSTAVLLCCWTSSFMRAQSTWSAGASATWSVCGVVSCGSKLRGALQSRSGMSPHRGGRARGSVCSAGASSGPSSEDAAGGSW